MTWDIVIGSNFSPAENTYVIVTDKCHRFERCEQVTGFQLLERNGVKKHHYSSFSGGGFLEEVPIFATRGSFTVTSFPLLIERNKQKDDYITVCHNMAFGCYFSIDDLIRRLGRDLSNYAITWNKEDAEENEIYFCGKFFAVNWLADCRLFDVLEKITGLVYDRHLFECSNLDYREKINEKFKQALNKNSQKRVQHESGVH